MFRGLLAESRTIALCAQRCQYRSYLVQEMKCEPRRKTRKIAATCFATPPSSFCCCCTVSHPTIALVGLVELG